MSGRWLDSNMNYTPNSSVAWRGNWHPDGTINNAVGLAPSTQVYKVGEQTNKLEAQWLPDTTISITYCNNNLGRWHRPINEILALDECNHNCHKYIIRKKY